MNSTEDAWQMEQRLTLQGYLPKGLFTVEFADFDFISNEYVSKIKTPFGTYVVRVLKTEQVNADQIAEAIRYYIQKNPTYIARQELAR